MKHLAFKLTNENYPNIIVNPNTLFLLDDSTYALLKDSKNNDILKEAIQVKKDNISYLIANRNTKEVLLYDSSDIELLRLKFKTFSILKQFINAFPNFKKETNQSVTRIKPIFALLFMLFTYSFIWAGTRPTSADINPEGIRWRIAYLNVKFLEWLNGLIGQRQILYIGIFLFFVLLYLIFRPELKKIVEKQIKYSVLIPEERKE